MHYISDKRRVVYFTTYRTAASESGTGSNDLSFSSKLLRESSTAFLHCSLISGVISAFITAALLMARSGHTVHLLAPDVDLIGMQPPLRPGRLLSSLVDVGADLLPGICFSVHAPRHIVDLEVRFGRAKARVAATQSIVVSATSWSAHIVRPGLSVPWPDTDWPFGGMACGALAAGELFKRAMWKLRAYARNTRFFEDLFAETAAVHFRLAPDHAPMPEYLGAFDMVSAGAITNCATFALARIPSVRGAARIIDDDISTVSNLNRNALLLRSMLGSGKASGLAAMNFGKLQVKPIGVRYDPEHSSQVEPFADHVLVGVDHIPTRWSVQEAVRTWLGVGATSHWSSMASFHNVGLACAGCLHPSDDGDNGDIPTIAFVSFWAGLLLATYFVRSVGGETLPINCQQTYLSPLRPEHPWISPIAKRNDCPVSACAVRTSSGVQLQTWGNRDILSDSPRLSASVSD